MADKNYTDAMGVRIPTTNVIVPTLINGNAYYQYTTGNDSNTSALLHMADTDLIDSSSNAYTTTKGGSVARSSTKSKFNGYSAVFDGSARLALPKEAGNGIGLLDFAVEGQFNFTSTAFTFLIGQWLTAGNLAWIFYYNANTLNFSCSTDGTNNVLITNSWTPTADTWYHLVASRYNGVLHMFANGTRIGTAQAYTSSIFTTSTTPVTVGADDTGGYSLVGYASEIRISKANPRFFAPFTAPTAPYA
jgi:hypothetical protein